MTFAPDNAIWFAEAGAKTLGRIACDSCDIEQFPAPSSIGIATLSQAAVDNSGNVWLTVHEGDNQLGAFSPPNTWKAFPIGYSLEACITGLPNDTFVDAHNKNSISGHIAE